MILQTLSALALQELVNAGCRVAALSAVEVELGPVVEGIVERFTDGGGLLEKALAGAGERAWRALEIALAGEGLFGWLDRADDRVFRGQVRDFLRTAPLPADQAEDFRKVCLRELRALRKDGHLGGSLQGEAAARRAGDLSRYGDPVRRLAAVRQAVDQIAGQVEAAGGRHLAQLLRLRPDGNDQPPLLVLAVRFFFRREVESHPALAQGLTFAHLEGLAGGQEAGFRALREALEGLEETGRQRMEDTLEELCRLQTDLKRAREAVEAVGGNVREVRREQQRQAGQIDEVLRRLDLRSEGERVSEQIRELHQEVLRALEARQMEARELHPRDSLSIHDERERRLVRALVDRFRSLPAEQQNQLPALLNALGKLEVAYGEFDDAQRDFQQASFLVRADARAAAEVHHNAYRTALERGAWDLALLKLRAAAALSPERFAPFPFEKYEPIRILGAGGFGVAVLCRHRFLDARVVVKVLLRDDLGEDVNAVFAEARLLRQLNHPAVIRILDCGFADEKRSTRPYLVMEYFEGRTLAAQVERHGPVTQRDLPLLARPIAEGLQAAHARGILHRDVKPGNILVRRSEAGWQVKVIDFGLALPCAVVGAAQQTGKQAKTLAGQSITGTLDYAAPEQMGRLPGVKVGFPADVYGFGRTCAFLLFRTPNISYQDYEQLEDGLADLLGRCLAERPERRPVDFNAVLDRLKHLSERRPAPGKGAARPTVMQTTTVLDALPVEPEKVEEIPVAVPAEAPRGPRQVRPTIRRNHADVTLNFNGHFVQVENNPWQNSVRVVHDGVVVAGGWLLFEGTYQFPAVEENEQICYEVIVRSSNLSWQMRPCFTIRRNGQVLFNDR
jgi:serine/threonine protein kinase